MKTIRISSCLLLVIACVGLRISAQNQNKQIVIAASTILDGKGGVLHDTRIVIDGSKIVRIDPNATPVDYDLRGLTIMPGWIEDRKSVV